MIIGILAYNNDNDRYGLLVADCWEVDGFHCGDFMDVWDSANEQWIPTRMEMHYISYGFPEPKRNDGWYLVGTSYSGNDLDGLKVKINKS